MTIPIAAITTLIYGLFSIIGGITGYQKAGSQMSLISGLISGLLLLIGAFFLFNVVSIKACSAHRLGFM